MAKKQSSPSPKIKSPIERITEVVMDERLTRDLSLHEDLKIYLIKINQELEDLNAGISEVVELLSRKK